MKSRSFVIPYLLAAINMRCSLTTFPYFCACTLPREAVFQKVRLSLCLVQVLLRQVKGVRVSSRNVVQNSFIDFRVIGITTLVSGCLEQRKALKPIGCPATKVLQQAQNMCGSSNMISAYFTLSCSQSSTSHLPLTVFSYHYAHSLHRLFVCAAGHRFP